MEAVRKRPLGRGQQVQEQYSNIRGSGSDAKKKKLLKTYLLGGGFKDAYFAMSATYTKSTAQEEESSFVPWKTALDYYGLSELKARIVSGTLQARKCPRDPRFWEVSKEVSTKKDTTRFDSKISGTASSSKGKKLDDLKSFIEAGHKNPLQDMGMENFTFSDDDASDEDDGAMDPSLKKLLGIKESAKDPVDMLETASVALSANVKDSKTQSKVKQGEAGPFCDEGGRWEVGEANLRRRLWPEGEARHDYHDERDQENLC